MPRLKSGAAEYSRLAGLSGKQTERAAKHIPRLPASYFAQKRRQTTRLYNFMSNS
jgi:hypothetical protein